MSTDVNLLGKGLRQLAFLILLFILSPISLTMGFKALKKYSESPEIYIAYLILGFSFIIIIFTFYFAFKTFKTLLNSIFVDSKK
ncbi:DUF6095 family protein [Polaribacter sp. MSW13]|uniref:DUF6095 family protein n=1 Tax=Polaribacter marinus TaxID=2916838 RepID=A0A9X1VKM5_9FLAO|nr:DUF6095 family protein [Polaribacter marinus]MCI2227765.1 DUF6095 family protein [Polaribacter marinus]